MKFMTTIVQDGNNTGIEVPAEVMSALGTAKRHAVVVTLAGYSYRSSVAPYKGRLMISLSAVNRAAAGVTGGDELEVDLELDTTPRSVTIPADLDHAFAADPNTRATFDALSFSNQNRIVTSVESAKTEATRVRRIEAAIAELSALA